MEAQELIKSLKEQLKEKLSKKNYQKVCSILGNIKSAYEKEFLATDFRVAKKAVSKMQSNYSKLLEIVPEKQLKELKRFISSCQSELNTFGHENYEHLQACREATGATVFGVPAYAYSGSSDDYDDYCEAQRLAEAFSYL